MIRRFVISSAAVASIEFALCGSAFVMMLFAATEFGRLMFTYHELAEASRIGARYAIVHGSGSGSPASAADIAAATAATTSLVSPNQVSVSFTPNNAPGSQVTVTIARPFTFLFGFLSTATLNLTSHATMVIAN